MSFPAPCLSKIIFKCGLETRSCGYILQMRAINVFPRMVLSRRHYRPIGRKHSSKLEKDEMQALLCGNYKYHAMVEIAMC